MKGVAMTRKYIRKAKPSTPRANYGSLNTATKIKSTEIRHFVGEVEFATMSDVLRRMNAHVVCGYSGDNFTGTPIYSYIQYHRNRFTAVATLSNLYFFPVKEIEAIVNEYFALLEGKKQQEQVLTPDVAELLRRLREKPELASALLELVA
jgi:hypothetical protein